MGAGNHPHTPAVTPTLFRPISSTSGIPILSELVASSVGSGRDDGIVRMRGIDPCGGWSPFAQLG